MKLKSYKAPIFLPGSHLQTIYPSLFRKIDCSFYQRERIETTDNDFLDLDWSRVNSKKLIIISHGLEGSSQRSYVSGLARFMNQNGWDALAWNFRSCSGEINRQLCFYHSGKTDDLATVIEYAQKSGLYDQIALAGFSMGGNLSLVYLGEQGSKAVGKISAAVVFSVPCDLKSSAEKLATPFNMIYMKRFLHYLHKKVKMKMELFPGLIDDSDYDKIKNFKDFDDRYTAPIHGFLNAEDYWQKCSSRFFISDIKIPVLIVNAGNDPFLTEQCFPSREVSSNNNAHLEIPDQGGHVGFTQFNKENVYWSERRAALFLETLL